MYKEKNDEKFEISGNVCEICGEKLEKIDRDALYYCAKCMRKNYKEKISNFR